mgnify:CR=1 FL=1
MKRFITQKEYEYTKEVFHSLYLYNVSLIVSNYEWVDRINRFLHNIGIPLKSVVWSNSDCDGKCSINKYLEKGESSINEDHLIVLYSSIVQKYCAESYLDCSYLHNTYSNYDMSTDVSFKIAETVLRKVQLTPIQFYKYFIESICDAIEIPYGIYFKGTYKFQHSKYPKEAFINNENEGLNNWYFNCWNRTLKETDKRDNNTCAPNLHLKGYFRKLYELNIITEKHISRIINGITLREWIVSSEKNGKLLPFGSNTYLWIIDVDEINRIQTMLAKENLIITDDNFDWNDVCS